LIGGDRVTTRSNLWTDLRLDRLCDLAGTGEPMVVGAPNRGGLVIIGVRPSMGKTALAVNIACNAARSARVLVLSMKMTLKELIDRIIASRGSVELQKVGRPEQLSDAKWGRHRVSTVAMAELGLHMGAQPALSLLQVRIMARRVKRTRVLDLLAVDYLRPDDGRP
jgi:replicative DNA helicase